MKLVKLTIEKLPGEDAWKDIVRIPKAFRIDCNDRHVHRGKICRLTVGNKSKWVILHGLDSDQPVIQMDLNVRIALGVKKGHEYEFKVEQIGRLLALWFPWKASDPAYRLPAQLSIVAFILGVLFGVLGIGVGLIPLYNERHKAPTSQHSESSAVPTPSARAPK